MTDLNSATNADLRAFYQKYYSPGNATLVVSGSFDPVEAKRQIERYYGAVPREEVTRPTITPEPPQTKERRTKIEREAQSPSVAIAYRTPDLSSNDNYALDLLSTILGSGESSRLHRELVYSREMALGVNSYNMGQVLSGKFQIQLNLKTGINPDRALALVESEVEKVRERPVTARELDKARNILMKGYVDQLKKLSGRARVVATYETFFGDFGRMYRDLELYQKVTVADVRRVANDYLKPSRRNIVTVIPRRAGGKK